MSAMVASDWLIAHTYIIVYIIHGHLPLQVMAGVVNITTINSAADWI